MGMWGTGTFDSDVALDFINEEVDRHVSAIEAIFADESRFRLDEGAEGELMPKIEILLVLCECCGDALPERLNPAVWKASYLAMYDDQIEGLEPTTDYKRQRRAIIEARFDSLINQHRKRWQ